MNPGDLFTIDTPVIIFSDDRKAHRRVVAGEILVIIKIHKRLDPDARDHLVTLLDGNGQVWQQYLEIRRLGPIMDNRCPREAQ